MENCPLRSVGSLGNDRNPGDPEAAIQALVYLSNNPLPAARGGNK